jgi:hypothetical protein
VEFESQSMIVVFRLESLSALAHERHDEEASDQEDHQDQNKP